MSRKENDATVQEPPHPFPDEAWIGCPHCERPIDICAQIAQARREVGEFVLSLLFNGVPAIRITHPLELLTHECMNLEDRVRRASRPLSHLNVYRWAEPDLDEESSEDAGTARAEGAATADPA